MNGQLYTMDFFTNLHVGGLGDNLSVVDKQVQRDPITEYPYIQASSLKGAIRAHAEDVKMDTETIYAIFGKDGVPGSVDKGKDVASMVYRVGPDVLGNGSCFGSNNIRFADSI